MNSGENRPGDYLHECLGLHPEVTEIRYGRVQDLEHIERTTSAIRKGRRLTYDDLKNIRNSKVWDADEFGYWPSRPEIESALSEKHWDLWNLHQDKLAARKREAEIINRLLAIFRQIETVSVILRFVDPRRYGILSPPVEMVLGIGPSRSHAAKYAGYLNDLEYLKNAHRFTRAADVDMALWTLQVGVLEERLKSRLDPCRYQALREGFEQDQAIKDVRLANLAPQLLDIPRLDLARALHRADNLEMAGQIAGCEFERRVAKRLGLAPDDDAGLRKMIDGLSLDRKSNWRYQGHVSVRNRAVHGQHVTAQEVGELIEGAGSV